MNKNTANDFLVQGIKECVIKGMYSLDTGLQVRTRWADGTPAHYFSIGPKTVSYDILNGDLPINTLKSFPINTSIAEMRWIYQKESNNLAVARELGIHWWDSWDIGDGTIGVRYGETVRKHKLMNNLINTFIADPLSRRKIMSLWQEEDFKGSEGLKPCAHTTDWSLNIDRLGNYNVTLTLIQRSMDLLVTSSINAFQYYILAEALMAYLRSETGQAYRLVRLNHVIGDVHVYDRHLDAAREILERDALSYRDEGKDMSVKVIVPNFIRGWKTWSEKDFQVIRPKIDPLEHPIELAL